MTTRFAPAQNLVCSPLARVLRFTVTPRAHNDNAPAFGREAPSDTMLRAALRHFAEHGLGAAREARGQAEQAFFAGDGEAYHWWLGITRTLDRRLAE